MSRYWVLRSISFKDFFLFLIPLLLAFQAFFPGFIQSILINGRLIVIPCYIIYKLRDEFNLFTLILFICQVFILRVFVPPIDSADFFIIFFSLFSSVAFFKLGHFLGNSDADKSYFEYMIYGVNFLNVVTLLLYFLLVSGYINAEFFFEKTQKELVDGIFRFSIGNPLELPFVITCLLYASIILTNKKKSRLFSTSLNLIVVFVSQSRILVLLAFLLFILEFMKSSRRNKIIIGLLLTVFLFFVWDELIIIFESFLSRLSGEDYGSKDLRVYVLGLIFKSIDIVTLFVGNGLTSSTMVLKAVTGEYRTIESSLLQLLYELGLLGMFFFFGSMYIKRNFFLLLPKKVLNPIIILVWVQLFFFLSVFTLMPAIFFFLGVFSKNYIKRDPVLENTVLS